MRERARARQQPQREACDVAVEANNLWNTCTFRKKAPKANDSRAGNTRVNERDGREGRAKNSHKKGRQLWLAVGLQPALTGGRRRRRGAPACGGGILLQRGKGRWPQLVSEAPRGCFHAHFDDVGNQSLTYLLNYLSSSNEASFRHYLFFSV